jgi:hypothetical protein
VAVTDIATIKASFDFESTIGTAIAVKGEGDVAIA